MPRSASVRDGGGHAGGARQAVGPGQHQGADGGHHLRAVEQRQALLGLQHERLPGRARARASRGRLPAARPARPSPWPMSGRARWARGARSPEAPTLPCEGTTGWRPTLEHRAEPLDELRPAARVAEGQRVGAQQQHGAHDARAAAARRRRRRGSAAAAPAARGRAPAARTCVAREPKPVVTP